MAKVVLDWTGTVVQFIQSGVKNISKLGITICEESAGHRRLA
jgi:hypothetical protein